YPLSWRAAPPPAIPPLSLPDALPILSGDAAAGGWAGPPQPTARAGTPRPPAGRGRVRPSPARSCGARRLPHARTDVRRAMFSDSHRPAGPHMRRVPLYSSPDRSRLPGSTARASASVAPPDAPRRAGPAAEAEAPAGWRRRLAGIVARHRRVLIGSAGLVAVALVVLQMLTTRWPAPLTQEDIDAAVLHSL